MSNFTTKWVDASYLSKDSYTQVHVHRQGAVAIVEWYVPESEAFVQFESGLTLNVKVSKGIYKFSDENEVKFHDLTGHPLYKGHMHESLVRVMVRRNIAHRLNATSEEVEFIKDIILEIEEFV